MREGATGGESFIREFAPPIAPDGIVRAHDQGVSTSPTAIFGTVVGIETWLVDVPI